MVRKKKNKKLKSLVANIEQKAKNRAQAETLSNTKSSIINRVRKNKVWSIAFFTLILTIIGLYYQIFIDKPISVRGLDSLKYETSKQTILSDLNFSPKITPTNKFGIEIHKLLLVYKMGIINTGTRAAKNFRVHIEYYYLGKDRTKKIAFFDNSPDRSLSIPLMPNRPFEHRDSIYLIKPITIDFIKHICMKVSFHYIDEFNEIQYNNPPFYIKYLVDNYGKLLDVIQLKDYEIEAINRLDSLSS